MMVGSDGGQPKLMVVRRLLGVDCAGWSFLSAVSPDLAGWWATVVLWIFWSWVLHGAHVAGQPIIYIWA